MATRRIRQPGWWYPWTFVGGMLVVVVVNGVMISYALGTFPGLSTEDAYRRGLAYNQTIAAEAAQHALGWQAELTFEPSAATEPGVHVGRLMLELTDRSGAPLDRADVTGLLVRPAHGGNDQPLALDAQGQGRYGADLTLPLAGQWEARLLARRGDVEFQVNRRIIVP